MLLKEFLKNLDISICNNDGKNLRYLEPYFKYFDELQDKNIEIIEDISIIEEPKICITENGCRFKGKFVTIPNLINTKDLSSLKKNIKLYGVFLSGEDVVYRCSEDSFITNVCNKIKKK